MAASFPTSLKSYTTKVDDVDDVEAAHMNSVQEEIVAIETALGVGLTNPIIQVASTQSGALVTGTTAMPYDDTIPQNTEGSELLTLAITPKSATNKLLIVVNLYLANNGTEKSTVALFQDTTASAIAAVADNTSVASANGEGMITLTHYMTSGTTSSTTFKVRAGTTAGGVMSMNGSAGARKLGGVASSSITIFEIKV